MATLSKPVGFEYEFVDQVPEDYFCKLCKHVAREPNLVTCCSEILCKACVDMIVQDKKLCPSCQETELTSVKHVKYQRNILALEVHCTMKDRGCPWTGQLQHLNAHLDVATGDCQYVDVECPKKCVQKVQKRNVDTHLANECPNRDYRCPHCNFDYKYHVVSKHFDVCLYYPLACPNRCGATFERDDLEDHMKMCRLEEVQCVFNNAGCQAKFIRENEDEHMDHNTQKHLALMPAATLRISQDFEQKLQEQQEVFEKKFEQKDKQIKHVEQKLQEQQEVFEKKLEQKDEEHKQRMQQLGGQLKEFQEQKDEQMKLQEEKFESKLQEQKVVDQKLEELSLWQENMKKKYEQKQKENEVRMQQLGEQLQPVDEQVKQVEQKLQEQREIVEQKLDKQSREFQEQLGEQQKEFQETLKVKVEQIKKLEDQLQTNGQVIEQQQQTIRQICSGEFGVPPHDITLSNYRQEKARGDCIDSPPMYTHPGGYKFKLLLWPNSGTGTHVSVYVHSLRSDHNATLKFPAKFIITLQLLNQHRDQDHHMRDIQCEIKTSEKIGIRVGTGWKFIPHTHLEWNRAKQTQYLKDDCLRFRITKIVF